MDMLKVPSWIKAARKDDNDVLDDMPPPPPVAMLPEPIHDEELTIMQRAAALHAQMKRNIETAQVELAESVLGRQGDQEKIRFLEKENGELRLDIATMQNTIATLQSQVEEYRRFMDVWKDMNDKTRQVFDRFDIKGKPKKERKPRPKKERQGPAQATEAHGSEAAG